VSEIASGGETSRLYLAFKTVLTQNRQTAISIFDEIDAGLSGAAVERVGLKLKQLSRHQQVICITHQPQIACLADVHWMVNKTSRSQKTVTRITALDRDQRVEELARLMGGTKILPSNLAYARDLIERYQK
jgi:DNA repair protein RecN (Recombination protein N)